MTFGSRLGDEARRREISHQEAADMLGVSQATFSRWVNGTNLPGAAYFTKLARFLRISRDQVVEMVRAEAEAQSVGIDERLTRLEGKVDELARLIRARRA